MAVPTTSWSETTPLSTEAIPLGDDRIREMKNQLQEIVNVDHIMDNGNDTSFGYHQKLTFVSQGSDPSISTGNFILFSKDVSAISELHYLKADGTAVQLTSDGEFVAGFTNEIRIYAGLLANIPTGWLLCDGTGGRPNMVNYFVRGVSSSSVTPGTNVSGGTVTLSVANMYPHSHTVTTSTSGEHSHSSLQLSVIYYNTLTGVLSPTSTSLGMISVSTGNSDTHTHTVTDTTTFANTAKTFSPLYYEVAFIIKT